MYGPTNHAGRSRFTNCPRDCAIRCHAAMGNPRYMTMNAINEADVRVIVFCIASHGT